MNENMRFVAGQYIDFLLKDGKRRSYSIASKPITAGRHRTSSCTCATRPAALFTDHVFATMKERDLLRFEGPLGTFYLREDSDEADRHRGERHRLRADQGDARVRVRAGASAAADHALLGLPRPKRDLYMLELPTRIWQRREFQLRAGAVRADARSAWTGRTGFVHRAVMEDFPDLSGYQVYACGAPVMVEAARARLQRAMRPAGRGVLRRFVPDRSRPRAGRYDFLAVSKEETP